MNIKRNFFKYVSLNIIGMLGLSCYILADTFFIAQGVGSCGLAALNLAIPIFSLINGTALMIGMGGATRFSISGDKTVFTRCLILDGIFAAVFLIAAMFGKPLACLLGADSGTVSYTSSYLRILLMFSPLFLLNECIICFVRNDKNPNLAMLAMLIGSLANVVLDYIFIFPFKWGMTGAALATGTAPFISLLILSAHFIKRKNTFTLSPRRFGIKAFGDICALGSASIINELASGIVMLVFNFILLELSGNTGVAAYGIIANIAMVIISVFTGISQGIQPLLSRFCGVGDMKSANYTLRLGIAMAVTISAVIYVISFIFAAPIADVFNKDGGALLTEMARNGLRIYFISFTFTGINILVSSYFAAVDMPKRSFILSIARGFAVIIPTACIMAYFFGINGVWLSVTVTELIVLILIPLTKKAEA